MDKSILAIVDVQPDFQASSSLSWGWALAAAAAIVVLAVAWVSLNVPKVTGPQPRPLLNPSQPDIWHKIAFVSKVVEGESWMRYRCAHPRSRLISHKRPAPVRCDTVSRNGQYAFISAAPFKALLIHSPAHQDRILCI